MIPPKKWFSGFLQPPGDALGKRAKLDIVDVESEGDSSDSDPSSGPLHIKQSNLRMMCITVRVLRYFYFMCESILRPDDNDPSLPEGPRDNDELQRWAELVIDRCTGAPRTRWACPRTAPLPCTCRASGHGWEMAVGLMYVKDAFDPKVEQLTKLDVRCFSFSETNTFPLGDCVFNASREQRY